MIPFPGIRRLALILLLLPQLIVLGLGRGAVVCIASDGHSRVEITAGDCCANPAPPAATQGTDPTVSPDEPDCGSCSDFPIVLDEPSSRRADTGAHELPPIATPALQLESGAVPETAAPSQWYGRILDRGRVPPPHLIHLRSVLLRC